MSDHGRETILVVQIDQPLCTRQYGDAFASPTGGCTAALSETNPRKCYNTRVTCQDPANYNPGTLTLTFSRPQLDLARYYGYVIPYLVGISTTSGAINLAAMDRSASALGQREVVTLTLTDHLHSDLLVDKYRLERRSGAASFGSPSETFDPYTRGSFWGKWLARNPYHHGYALRVYQGFLGDALADMRVRHYIVDRIEGPVDGQVKIVAKDLFSRIEARKAVAPTASRGELAADLTGTPATFSVTPAEICDEDYPAMTGSPSELYVVIGDEAIRCSRSGGTFTILERGALNTTQEDHDEEDLVQWVLVYSAQLGHEIVYDLLVNYSAIPASAIDLAEWDVRAASITDLFTARIAAPTPVSQLVGELCEQAGFTVWSDISTGMIEFAALRSSNVSPTVTDNEWIVEDSISVRRQDERRASQVWVYYGQKSPLESLDDRRNYHSRLLSVDLNAEDSTQYGEPAIREVFSRWIPQFGRNPAERCGERLLAMFRDPPLEAAFSMHASRDGELALARYFFLETEEVQDETGDLEPTAMAVVEIDNGEHEIAIRAQAVVFSEDVEDGVRTIFIENDALNLNLRTIHDSLYTPPVGGSPGEVVNFIVLEDLTVGSGSTSLYALRTGSWPSGVQLSMQILGRIQGKGGRGGTGGTFSVVSPTAGDTGGDALLAEYPITIDNASGSIWAGGGGGGGGGYTTAGVIAGGGGGGGSGTDGGEGGTCINVDDPSTTPCEDGHVGTATAGGAGGAGAIRGITVGGTGGTGGGPGLSGSSGAPGTGGSPSSAGAAGGSPGRAVVGDSLITWVGGSPNGDRGDVRGAVVA